MTLTLTTKFNIGDSVYIVQLNKKYIIVPCPFCGGLGTIYSYDKKYKINCPECKGKKEIENVCNLCWVIHNDVLTINSIIFTGDKDAILYRCNNDMNIFNYNKDNSIESSECFIFNNKEDACKECNVLNNILKGTNKNYKEI